MEKNMKWSGRLLTLLLLAFVSFWGLTARSVHAAGAQISWVNPHGNVSATNAVIYATARANCSGRFSAASGTLYTSSGVQWAYKSESASHYGSSMAVWYDIQKELGRVLSPGRSYYLRFSVTFAGRTYYSPFYQFTTSRPTVAVQKIKLSKTFAYVKKGNQLRLRATIIPTNATDRAVAWCSSNTKIAGVSSGGIVTAKKRGTCYITAFSRNGVKTRCRIIVY